MYLKSNDLHRYKAAKLYDRACAMTEELEQLPPIYNFYFVSKRCMYCTLNTSCTPRVSIYASPPTWETLRRPCCTCSTIGKKTKDIKIPCCLQLHRESFIRNKLLSHHLIDKNVFYMLEKPSKHNKKWKKPNNNWQWERASCRPHYDAAGESGCARLSCSFKI